MGFRVEYEALEALHNSISAQTNDWLSGLESMKSGAEGIIHSSNIKGSGASNIKQYYANIHLTIIQLLNELISLHADNYLLYKYDYRNSVDPNVHTIIDEDEVNALRETLESNNSAAIAVNDAVEDALFEVRDIFSFSFQDVSSVDAAHQAAIKIAQEVCEHVNIVEDKHAAADFSNTESMITALKTFIAEMAGKSRGFMESFVPDDLLQSAAFQSLREARLALEAERLRKEALIKARKEEKDEVIRRYEEENPGTAEKFERLLDRLSEDGNRDPALGSFTDEDIREIKYIAYNAEEPYRTIYLNSLDLYSPGDLSGKIDGMFIPVFDLINVKMVDEPNNPRGPYTTFFHESGHAVDYCCSDNLLFNSMTYRNENGESLMDVLYADVRADITQTVERYTNDPEMEKHIIEYIMGGDKGKFDSLTPDEQNLIQKSIVPYYADNSVLGGAVNEAASDVYGGVTNNIIIGDYGHRQDYYWYIMGQPTNAQCMELWAEYFSYGMTGNGAAMSSLRARFPDASQFMDEMAAALAGGD